MNSGNKVTAQNQSPISLAAIQDQIGRILPAVGVGVLISLGGVGSTIFLARMTGNPIWKLAKDPAQVLSFPLYIGLLSNMSGLLWIVAAALCLFSSEVLRLQGGAKTSLNFIRISGIISLWLALDDLFLLHDRVLPQFLEIPEGFWYIVYLLIIAAYLVYFSAQILKHEYLLLLIAVLLLGVSRRFFVAIPFLDQFYSAGDMLKFSGIVFWLVFFHRTAIQVVSASINNQKG